ncbi:MAG: trimethylamine methyltransferase family protein [Desulfobacterales bacterium]|nr:MAG: trimethylamine methyltransferase family protein [Desulfobacterales bacterium]
MSYVKPRIRVLTKDQIEHIHDYSLKILAKVGIRVDSERARDVFENVSGISTVDNILRIPPELVDWALKVAPSVVDIYNRRGEPVFQLGDIPNFQTRFGTGVTNLYYQDPMTDEVKPFTRKHMEITTRLGDALPNFDVVSTAGIIQDYPPDVIDLYGTLEMVANTIKPLVVLVSEDHCFDATMNLLEHLHGNLAERPFIIPYLNPITPLVLNESTTDKMVAAIERDLPFIYNSVGMAGATSPITPAGTLALLNAELLAGLVFSQLIKEGTPIIVGILATDFDMKNMQGYYTPRTLPLNLACAEMMAYYGLPHSGSSGSGVGWGADLLGSSTLWINHLTSCLGKVGLAPFVGGRFESLVFSSSFAVYANEVVRQARLYGSGFQLDDESVALNEIETIGPGGNFFMADQTVKLCRNTNFTVGIWPYLVLDDWEAAGKPRADDLLRQHTRDLLDNLAAPEDHDELIAKGEAFIRKALP